MYVSWELCICIYIYICIYICIYIYMYLYICIYIEMNYRWIYCIRCFLIVSDTWCFICFAYNDTPTAFSADESMSAISNFIRWTMENTLLKHIITVLNIVSIHSAYKLWCNSPFVQYKCKTLAKQRIPDMRISEFSVMASHHAGFS